MKKWAARILILFLCAVMVLGIVLPALATELDSEVTGNQDNRFQRIRTVEDLMAIAEDPDGSYLLVEDLDMTGVEWKPLDFSGIFDGAGHAILNLNLTQAGDTRAEAYDGNRKAYDATYAGLFGTLNNAKVINLNLLNVRGVVETDEPCFMGGLTGYMYESTIAECTVTGNMELRAHNQIFGIGGVAGFGSGWIESCNVDVILTCTDTDAATKDEQFLGGVYSTGFIDVVDTVVNVNGFASEHGYAHNGGIVGMYLQHPLGTGRTGWIVRNTVSGKITFFEANTDRRAYCAPFAGEVLVGSHNMYENMQRFTRDERWTYDQELRPCMCENPVYTETVVEPGCESFGYTIYECPTCGFTDRNHYTLYQHTVTQWEVLEPSTLKTEGTSEGECDLCGETVQRKDPVLEVPETEETKPPKPTETIPPEPVVEEKPGMLFPALALATAGVAVFAIFLARKMRKKGKFSE